jgi:hypothetical protein
VRIAGRAVGCFTPNMSDRYRALVEATNRDGLKPTAIAEVRSGEKDGKQLWRVQGEMQRV